MWTAILATLNLIDGADHDVWSVNTEAEYLEEGELVEGTLDLDVSLREAPSSSARRPLARRAARAAQVRRERGRAAAIPTRWWSACSATPIDGDVPAAPPRAGARRTSG